MLRSKPVVARITPIQENGYNSYSCPVHSPALWKITYLPKIMKKVAILLETFGEENFHAINWCKLPEHGNEGWQLALFGKMGQGVCYQVSAIETCPDLRDEYTHHHLPWRNGARNSWFNVFNVKRKSGEVRFWRLFFRIENFLWNCPGFFVWLGFFWGSDRAYLRRDYFQRKLPCFANEVYPCNVQFHHRCINFRKECVGMLYCSAILRLPLLQRQPSYKNACADTVLYFRQNPHLKAKLNHEAQKTTCIISNNSVLKLWSYLHQHEYNEVRSEMRRCRTKEKKILVPYNRSLTILYPSGRQYTNRQFYVGVAAIINSDI